MKSSAPQVALSVGSSKRSGRESVEAHGAPLGFAELFFLGNGSCSRVGRSHRGQRGVGALMLAVLEDGMRSYLSSVNWIRTEAERWVMSPRQGSPCAFAAACEVLGLDPHIVRAALGRLRREQTPRKKTIRRGANGG